MSNYSYKGVPLSSYLKTGSNTSSSYGNLGSYLAPQSDIEKSGSLSYSVNGVDIGTLYCTKFYDFTTNQTVNMNDSAYIGVKRVIFLMIGAGGGSGCSGNNANVEGNTLYGSSGGSSGSGSFCTLQVTNDGNQLTNSFVLNIGVGGNKGIRLNNGGATQVSNGTDGTDSFVTGYSAIARAGKGSGNGSNGTFSNPNSNMNGGYLGLGGIPVNSNTSFSQGNGTSGVTGANNRTANDPDDQGGGNDTVLTIPFLTTTGLSGFGSGKRGGDYRTPLLYPSSGYTIRSGYDGNPGIIRMYCYSD
jgi:hypothetical protein